MVNAARMQKELEHLITIDSETFYEGEMAEYLLKKLQTLGFETEMDGVGFSAAAYTG